MPFVKAHPQQARLKMSMYGPPGSGKTFTALLFAEGLAKLRNKRVAVIDTEHGTDFYAQAVAARQVHPEVFDFDAIYTKSLSTVLEELRALDPATHGVIVLDSITHLWSAAIEAYEGKMTSQDTIPMQAWGKIKKPYKDLMSFLIHSSFDVLVLGRQKNVWEEDDKGKLSNAGVAMRAEGETPYEFHICARMDLHGERGGDSKAAMFVEKDRSGVLQGRTYIYPNFKTIEPLLPLLGEVQAPAEDEEERIVKDGELIASAEDRQTKKAEKSAALLVEFQAKIQASANVEALGVAAAEIKKQSRYMLEEHTGALRQYFNARRDQLVAAATGAV